MIKNPDNRISTAKRIIKRLLRKTRRIFGVDLQKALDQFRKIGQGYAFKFGILFNIRIASFGYTVYDLLAAYAAKLIADGKYNCVLAASFGVGGSYSAVVLKSV